jgi:hypothetical protein
MSIKYKLPNPWLIFLTAAFIFTSCQTSFDSSLEESVAPYLELSAIDGASNTTITVNRGESHGLDSYFAFDLSNINHTETNGLIREGVIEGWCLEWNKPIRQNNDVHPGVELFNTFGSDTWKAPNYLMSIKDDLKAENPDLTYKEIQVALWSLIEEPAFNVDQVLKNGRMPSRMMTNGQPNFDVEKTKQIVNRVRNEVPAFEYKPGGPVLLFARTNDDQQNGGGVTQETEVVNSISNFDDGGWDIINATSGSLEVNSTTPDRLNGEGSMYLFGFGAGQQVGTRITENFGAIDDLSTIMFDWYRLSSSTISSNYTPEIAIFVSKGTDSWRLQWQGEYNGYSTSNPAPVDTWVTENVTDGNFWRIPVDDNGTFVGYGACSLAGDPYGCFQYDRKLDDAWLDGFNIDAVEITIGNPVDDFDPTISGDFNAAVDFVTINNKTYDFEPLNTP